MSEALTEQQIEVASEWWTNAVVRPKFDNMGNTGTASERSTMGFASMFATMGAKPVSDELREKFKAALKEELTKERPWYVSVDYGPDAVLARAARSAGLSENNFPWKTDMWLRDGGVSVSCGYCAPIEELLPIAQEPPHAHP